MELPVPRTISRNTTEKENFSSRVLQLVKGVSYNKKLLRSDIKPDAYLRDHASRTYPGYAVNFWGYSSTDALMGADRREEAPMLLLRMGKWGLRTRKEQTHGDP
jgi:hypothetical protein